MPLRTLRVASSLAFAAHAVDLPGHGFADRDATHRFDMDAMISFVVDVLDQLSHEPIVLVGTSFGGLIACHTAHRHPEHISPRWSPSAQWASRRSPRRQRRHSPPPQPTARSTPQKQSCAGCCIEHELIDAAWIAEEHAFARTRSADGDGLAGLRTYLHPPTA